MLSYLTPLYHCLSRRRPPEPARQAFPACAACSEGRLGGRRRLSPLPRVSRRPDEQYSITGLLRHRGRHAPQRNGLTHFRLRRAFSGFAGVRREQLGLLRLVLPLVGVRRGVTLASDVRPQGGVRAVLLEP